LSSSSQQWVEEIHRAAERAAGLTRQLLAFSRRQMLAPEVLDVNVRVAEVERMLRRLIGEDIRLVTRLHPRPCPVLMDPSQLEQVLVNLAVNARDAMPTGGELTLSTSRVRFTRSRTFSQCVLAPGEYVRLTVRDTGTGMSPEVQSQLFEPFFTTKPVGSGTGLGLSTVYGILQQSGGGVHVESAPGAGATFTLYLPFREAEAAAPPVSAPETERAGGSETVLLVEDQEEVRQLMRQMLERAGYQVLAAADGPSALRVSEAHASPIQLLLTDVVMPGMSGPDLAAALARSRPEMKVLFMSGYTDDTVLRHGVLTQERFLIQKPFSSADLTRKLREVLQRDVPS
jgi:CheY-like chemotaxis protein